MNRLPVRRFQGRDGTELVYRETGGGRPLVLIHGYLSTATANWVRYGHAKRIAARGYRVIMPDLRGHGDSAKPHDPAAYPPDVLTDDGFALIEHLGLNDYDLGGYSLGGRTAIRMLARGATPGRVVAAGVGLDGILNTASNGAYFRRILTNSQGSRRGSAEWKTQRFLRSVAADPVALLQVLGTITGTPHEALTRIGMPALVLVGADDRRRPTAEELAAVLPDARYAVVPGNHMSAVIGPQLGTAIADFLGAPPGPTAF